MDASDDGVVRYDTECHIWSWEQQQTKRTKIQNTKMCEQFIWAHLRDGTQRQHGESITIKMSSWAISILLRRFFGFCFSSTFICD